MTIRSIAGRLYKVANPVEIITGIEDRLKRELPGLEWSRGQVRAEYHFIGTFEDEEWVTVSVRIDSDIIEFIKYNVLGEEGMVADSITNNEQKIDNAIGIVAKEVKNILPDNLVETLEKLEEPESPIEQ